VAGSSSLPFTGADIEELAVVGAGAVLVGGLLIRRRRNAA
jgi:LPXTG-motif cell wall-anchored protein